AALRDPKVASLKTVRDQPDPVSWLIKELKVDFQAGSEVLRITLAIHNPEEAALIVNAIADAYLKEIVNVEKYKRSERLTKLKDTYNKYQETLKVKQRTLQGLAGAIGSGNLDTVNFKHQLAYDQLATLKRELIKLSPDLTKAQADAVAQQA